jgi:hypothetical protein
LPSNDQMDDARPAECGSSRDVSRTITLIQMVSLALTILLIAECSALLAISKRQEMMLETLLRQSGERQDISAQKLHETHCQVENYRNGSGR